MPRRFAQPKMPLEYALRMFDQAMLRSDDPTTHHTFLVNVIQQGGQDVGGLVV
jgi:hypothetical protein